MTMFIRLGNKTSLVFFIVLTLFFLNIFVFYSKSVGTYVFISIEFSKLSKLTYSHRTGVPLIHLVVVNAATQMNLDLQHIIYDTMHYKLIIADSVTYSKQTVSKSSLVKILILANRPF